MYRRWFICVASSLCSISFYAQTADWRLMHQGNRHFRNGHYDQAERCYMNAKRLNPSDTRASFNLGDTYLAKHDAEEAKKQFEEVVKNEKGTTLRGMAHHNLGYISQTAALQAEESQRQQLLREAIGHYKNALRCNPHDEGTRYNLALCQKQLREESQNKDSQQRKNQQQEKERQEKESQKQPPQEANHENPREKQQAQQLLNLARQAEQRARRKVNTMQPRKATLDKNW